MNATSISALILIAIPLALLAYDRLAADMPYMRERWNELRAERTYCPRHGKGSPCSQQDTNEHSSTDTSTQPVGPKA